MTCVLMVLALIVLCVFYMFDYVVYLLLCVCLFFVFLCLVYVLPPVLFDAVLFLLFGVLLRFFVYALCVIGLGFNCFVCVSFFTCLIMQRCWLLCLLMFVCCALFLLSIPPCVMLNVVLVRSCLMLGLLRLLFVYGL